MTTTKKQEMIWLLNNRSYERLENEFITLIDRGNYLPRSGEWETMATQLATAVCKIKYRYFNDGDKYTSLRCKEEVGTFANRIHNNCFKLKRFDDYEDNLKYMLIMAISIIDSLKDTPAKGSVYEEKGTRTGTRRDNFLSY